MIPMIPMIPYLAQAAELAKIEVAPDAFVVERGDTRAAVREIALPKPIVIDSRFRLCRVGVSWEDGRWVARQRDGCHPNVMETVDEAAARWVIDVSNPPSSARELFEYWYVFPAVKGEAARVFVRQAFEQELTLTAPEIDVLEWSVKGRLFPEYPPAALGQDTVLTRCNVRIDIAPSGVPGEIAIDGCDQVFEAELEDNLRSWRFGVPELDGVPFWSGVTFGVQFTKPLEAGEEGRVTVLFPPDADLGSRTRARAEEAIEVFEPPPKPTWPPLFVVDHKSFAEVGVYDLRWPEVPPLDHEATCDVLFQVNSQRRVWAWTEGCDEGVRAPVEAAANQWLLMHGTRAPGERFARFRGTFVFPAGGGHPTLRLPADDLVSPERSLPEHVATFRAAKTLSTFPPQLPKAFATDVLEDQVTCEYEVAVDRRGRPAELVNRGCPASLATFAEKAVGRWRWTPAESDGQPIESRVTVRIRFDLRVDGASAP